MILVEGLDGAGKTTLVNRICNEFSLPVGARGVKDRDKLYTVTRQDTANAMAACVRAVHPPTVWDRLGPISDPIYAPLSIPRREAAFSDDYGERFYRFLALFHVPVFICMPPLEVVRENVAKHHQMEGVARNIDRIFNGYCSTAISLTHFDCNVHIYNYQMHDFFDDVVPIIANYNAKRKDREC